MSTLAAWSRSIHRMKEARLFRSTIEAAAFLAERPVMIGYLLLVTVLSIMWMVRTDYGLSIDEMPLIGFGQQAWFHFFRGAPVPSAIDWKFHSPLLQVAQVALFDWQQAFGYDMLAIKRGFAVLLFGAGALAFYGLARRFLRHEWAATGALAMFLLSPRLFAHAFHNPKDVPTLVFFTISILLLDRFLERQTVGRLLPLALVSGFAISLRPFALLLPAFGVLAFFGFAVSQPTEWKRSVLSALAVLGATALATVAVWPLLWSDPIGGFMGAIANNVSRADEGLYMGRLADPRFPWHYLFVWMFLTIPLAYTALGCFGYVRSVGVFLRRPKQSLSQDPLLLLVILWLTLPIVARFLGKIGLFDEWRHVLFIYPAFLLLAARGLVYCIERSAWLRWTAVTLLSVQCIVAALWMIRVHPFQYMYFTVPSDWVRGRFEMDYWGLSYKQGFEWILDNDPRPVVLVYIRDTCGVMTTGVLPDEYQGRLRVTRSPRSADYILDTLRWTHYEHAVPEDRVVHTLQVDGLPFLWIYQGPYDTPDVPHYPWCDFCVP